MSQSGDQQIALPGATLAPLDASERHELEALRLKTTEHDVTLSVLAVITERLRLATGEPLVLIEDEELANSPALIARRDPQLKRISLSTAR